MTQVKLLCAHCGKAFYRPTGRVKEARKFAWKFYCSLACQYKQRNLQRQYTCSRPSCGKIFSRAPGDIASVALYCSRSCAVAINNVKVPKRKAHISECIKCHKIFKGQRPYCSRACKTKGQVISAEDVCKSIKDFFTMHGRIPLKRELLHYSAARNRFGTWNAAIIAAEFKPNPVLFSEKHIAKDGHSCDSFSEKIIDDWLVARGVVHERNVKYPGHPKLTTDFFVGNSFIEFFGLNGEITAYDKTMRRKRRIAKAKNIQLIALYPKDLFPKNRLAKILTGANTL